MVLFLWNPVDNGTRKGGGSSAAVKTVRWTVFSPWESPLFSERTPLGVWAEKSHPAHDAPFQGAYFLWNPVDNGTRKAVKKTCRWHVFRPWESPVCRVSGKQQGGRGPVDNGTRRERPARRAGKKVSGGHFFSSGESPLFSNSPGEWSPVNLLRTLEFHMERQYLPVVFGNLG